MRRRTASERRLRELLGEIEVPGATAAERRGRALAAAAFAERAEGAAPRSRPPRPRRLALALALGALLAGLLLSPAGATVRDWIGERLGDGGQGAGLRELPGGGRLLVQSEDGPWVVQPDGSRRLLGDYQQATWSPHGLFLAVASGRTLTAVEPDGTARWSITAPGWVRDPRWSPSGYRIAYRAGRALRVTAADGDGDRLLARHVATAPAWSPLGASQLAYVSAGGRLRIAESETGETLAEAPALAGTRRLEWSGETLLETGGSALQVRSPAPGKLSQGVAIGPPSRLPLPAAALELRDAALSPDGATVAALVVVRTPGGPRSEVRLIDVEANSSRRLYGVAGRPLGELAWSPDGSRLLIARPGRDEWLFLPRRPIEGRVVSGVAAAFSPGHRPGAFPTVAGWCCSAEVGG